jgi:hypothetical protein
MVLKPIEVIFQFLDFLRQYAIILSSRQDHSLLAWFISGSESPKTFYSRMSSTIAIQRL